MTVLKVPSLDDLSYDAIFESARARVPALTDEWTDLNHHDPGITTLQLFSWLCDMLQYYMNATGEEHRLRYLKLLGLRPAPSTARCVVALSGEGRARLARGRRLAAGAVPFELEESTDAPLNRLVSLHSEEDGVFFDLMPESSAGGAPAPAFGGQSAPGDALYLGFAAPLGKAGPKEFAKNQSLRLFVDLFPTEDRTPPAPGTSLFGWAWEYWDGEAWRGAPLVRDDTCGLLAPGFVELDLPGGTRPLAGHGHLPTGHYLRARLAEGSPDAPLCLKAVYCNCLRAAQTHTLAEAIEMEYAGQPVLPIDYHIGPDQLVEVAVGDGEGYSLWYGRALDGAGLCSVEAGQQPWQRVIRFDENNLPPEGAKLLVLVADEAYARRSLLGVTMGYANEEMETDLEDVCHLRLALCEEREGRPYYRLWDEWQGGEMADDARVFTLLNGGEAVRFGNATQGMQPPGGLAVQVVAAKTTLWEAGRVRAGQVDRFADETDAPPAVQNLADATGGARGQSAAQLAAGLEAAMLAGRRAVSAGDYRRIALATPGLRLHSAAVISAGAYAGFYPAKTPEYANTVLVAVRPGGAGRPLLSAAYAGAIRRHMEAHRLLTTQIKVLPTGYAQVEVYGRIALKTNDAAARQRVLQALEEWVDATAAGSFGGAVVYSRLFARLEMMEEVRQVSQLSLSCAGEYAKKNAQGDILVAPDALACLGATDIEFVGGGAR